MLPATPTPDEWCPVGATIPRSQIESLASCQLDEPDVVPVQDEHRSQTAGRTGLIFTVAVKIGLRVNMAESRFLSTYRTSPDRKVTRCRIKAVTLMKLAMSAGHDPAISCSTGRHLDHLDLLTVRTGAILARASPNYGT